MVANTSVSNQSFCGSAKVGKRGFPSLRRHATGVYFWREKGKDTYCGSNPAVAQRAWLERFGTRLTATSSTPVADVQTATPFLPPSASSKPQSPKSGKTSEGRTVADVAKRLMGLIESQCTPERAVDHQSESFQKYERQLHDAYTRLNGARSRLALFESKEAREKLVGLVEKIEFEIRKPPTKGVYAPDIQVSLEAEVDDFISSRGKAHGL